MNLLTLMEEEIRSQYARLTSIHESGQQRKRNELRGCRRFPESERNTGTHLGLSRLDVQRMSVWGRLLQRDRFTVYLFVGS